MNKIIGSAGMKLAYAYLNSNPERNVPKLMDWVDRMAISANCKIANPLNTRDIG